MIYISWYEIDDYIDSIIEQIEETGTEVKKVVGIARGGLIPAVMISHRLRCDFDMVCWQTRDGNIQDIEKIKSLNKGTLIVDDICDTGKTIADIKELNDNLKYAVLINKQEVPMVDFSAKNLYNSDWICYPWER